MSWLPSQMELASHWVWPRAVSPHLALGRSRHLSDPSFPSHSMSNQHLPLRGVCNGKYCWVEVFQTLDVCWVALEAPPVLAGPSAVAVGAHPSPPTRVSAPCAGAFPKGYVMDSFQGSSGVCWKSSELTLHLPVGDGDGGQQPGSQPRRGMRRSAPGLPPMPTTL